MRDTCEFDGFRGRCVGLAAAAGVALAVASCAAPERSPTALAGSNASGASGASGVSTAHAPSTASAGPRKVAGAAGPRREDGVRREEGWIIITLSGSPRE